MMDKIILRLHLLLIGIMVGGMIPYQSAQQIVTLGMIFSMGCLVLHNIIYRMLNDKEHHIFK